MSDDVQSFWGVARTLGVNRHTVADLVRCLGLHPKPMRHPLHKGLDARDIQTLRRALTPIRKPSKIAS